MRRLYIFLLSILAAIAFGTVFSFFFVSLLKAPTDSKIAALAQIAPLKIFNNTEKQELTTSTKPVTILAVGDIMLGRNVEKLAKAQGADYPFLSIKPFFETFDFVFANLEGPIPVKHKPTPGGSTQFSFTKDTGETLKKNGVDIVSLANNHTFDYGQENFDNTGRVLDQAGVLHMGSQRSADPMYVVTTTIRNEHFTFIAFNDVFGVLDVTQAVKTVQQFANDGSFVFVSIHWGDEYKLVGNKRQASIAHKLIDAGADVIIGQHPHVVQQVEIYNDKPIFYSCGNFIFDQNFSQNTQEGLGVGLSFSEHFITYTLYPINIPQSQPTLMMNDKKMLWLKALAKRSPAAIASNIEGGTLTLPR